MEAKTNNSLQDKYRLGLTILVLLATFTVGEFFIGRIAVGWIAPLFLIAIFKAWLILRDYMHISRVFAGDEETHS